MIIDLIPLLNRIESSININNTISFSEDYIKNSNILRLDDVKVNGIIALNEEDKIKISIDVEGIMILEDSISLDEISYPFSLKIEEILENNTNSIDIMDILWQNIVLEVPLKLTEVKEFSQYQGDGWRLVSEEEMNKENNPFSNLKDLLGEE